MQRSADSVDTHPTPPRVLVVDDESELRQTIGRGLTRSGYDVAFAANGLEALGELEAEADVDAVVTDVNMPVMSGPELAGEVLDRHPGVPVLFVSASPVPDHLLDHPLVDRIRKPPSMGAVRSRVSRLLAAAAAAHPAATPRTGVAPPARWCQPPSGYPGSPPRSPTRACVSPGPTSVDPVERSGSRSPSAAGPGLGTQPGRHIPRGVQRVARHRRRRGRAPGSRGQGRSPSGRVDPGPAA